MQGVNRAASLFGDRSSLHGVGHVFSPGDSWFKRIFWTTILVLCAFGALVMLRSSLYLYSKAAVSFSVETNYLDWETPFPALTVCESTGLEKVKAYLALARLPTSLANFYKDVTYWNAKYCKTCNHCRVNVTCSDGFVNHVKRIRLKCSQLMTDCWWDDKPFRCCDRFVPIETEYGVCYSFNSAMGGNASTIMTVSRKAGLPSLKFTAAEAIWIRVHSPDDVVSAMMDNVLGSLATLPLVSDVEILLKVEQTVSDLSVSSLQPEVRHCLYGNERPVFADKWPFKNYTYSACKLYCRMVSQFHHCNCTHHLMPRMVDFPVCDVEGLICLNKNKDNYLHIIASKENADCIGTTPDGLCKESLENPECTCPMGCEEILYKLVHRFFTRHSGIEAMAGRGTRGTIRLAQLPSLRVRRLAIRDTLGLVVDIGGVGGVFFGASLLSIIECVYLLCIRRRQ